MMNRREWLHSSISLAALGGQSLLWAPSIAADTNRLTHDAYFSALNDMLKLNGPGRPVMLLDQQRMRHNIDLITAAVGPDKTYRVVVKSLPSLSLLDAVMKRAKTQALMVFHQPFANAIADAFPDSDVLFGKPMPLSAARLFYARLTHTKFNPARQMQWLIDTPERLLQYQTLARQLGLKMRINFELDVGLRRGGFDSHEGVAAALKLVLQDPKHLEFAGFMGYEPQLTGLGADLKHPAVQNVLSMYNSCIATAKQAGVNVELLTRNGAGSHTLPIYRGDQTMNDLSAGSGVVKPTDFDTYHLAQNLPAIYIATPILKRYDRNPVMAAPPENMQRLYYIYGGYWKAAMVSPAAVGQAPYQSTNQSPILTSSDVDLAVDDYMFLRPTQSESVMLQFGDLMVVDQGQLTDTWPVFQQTG